MTSPWSSCGSSKARTSTSPARPIKLTLDISGLASARRPPPSGSRVGSGCRTRGRGSPTPGSGSGSRCGPSARLVRAIAHESGTGRLAVRVRPDQSDPHVVVVAFPWRHRDRARGDGPGGRRGARRRARRRRRGPAVSAAAASGSRPSRRATAPHTITPAIPVVAVTGTNGKTTTIADDRAHRPHGRPLVGWSNTDGIYLDGELVEAGDYSGPSGAGPGAGPPGGPARGHRDRPRRHPAQGHRPDPQRRLGGHQRHRRPPRPAGHRHARPARRGQGRRPADHPAAAAGPCSTATTRGSSRCAASIKAQPVGVLARPGLAGDPRDARRAAAGPPPSSTAGSRCCGPAPTPTRWSSWSTCR